MSEKTKNFYNETAEDFHNRNKDKDLTECYQAFEQHLSPGAHILDLGCGPGRDAKHFSENGYQVTGVDFSESMLEIARKEAPNAQFDLFDMETGNYSSLGHFDGIWAMASLLHIPHDQFPTVLDMVLTLRRTKDSPLFISLKEVDFREQFEREFYYWTRGQAEKVFQEKGLSARFYSEMKSERSHFHDWVLA